MKIVLDTKVLIAAFITHGACNELLEHCTHNHEVILSPFIIEEIKQKLLLKFGYSTVDADNVVNLLTSRFDIIAPVQLPEQTCRDQDDDKIIGTALAGGCECIVTGDKDLLDLQIAYGIQIVSPSAFWAFEK